MNPELQEYIEQHIDPHPDHLYQIERATNLRLLNGRMCSGHLQGRILKMLTHMIKPRRVLELGTFSGYSALCIAEALTDEATIDTIEVDDELEDFIRRNLALSPFGRKINLHIGDATEIIKSWPSESFDLIFVDADKRKYSEYYLHCIALLRPGGFLFADNTLWDGHVVEPEKFSDPQTKGIRDFNDMVKDDTNVEKVILPIRDGLTLIRKI